MQLIKLKVHIPWLPKFISRSNYSHLPRLLYSELTKPAADRQDEVSRRPCNRSNGIKTAPQQFFPISHLPQQFLRCFATLGSHYFNPQFQRYKSSKLEPYHQQCHLMRRACILEIARLQITLRFSRRIMPQRPQISASSQCSKAFSFSPFIPSSRRKIDKSGSSVFFLF